MKKNFDPEGDDYDYLTARAAGMGPTGTGENLGHWGSVTSAPKSLKVKYKLPEESYILLKGKNHPTWDFAVAGEEERGFEIKKYGDRYFSVPKQKSVEDNSQKILGFNMRNPYVSELEFFKKRPEVAGMATEDDAIILNPFSDLDDQQKNAVAKNEAIRLWLKKNNVQPKFNVTPEQYKFFRGTEYGDSKDITPMQHTIISRILTGDTSVGDITPMQKQWADWVKSQIPELQNQ
jgi:hypothetical protein